MILIIIIFRKEVNKGMDKLLKHLDAYKQYGIKHPRNLLIVKAYISQFLRKGYHINRTISVEEMHQHFEKCLGFSVPYDVFAGAVYVFGCYQVIERGKHEYADISNNSPIIRLKRRDRCSEHEFFDIYQIKLFFGDHAITHDLFERGQPKGA